MLHGYVIAVSRSPKDVAGLRRLSTELDRGLQGWSKIHSDRLAVAWCYKTASSRLSHRQLPGGCLIGRDFEAGDDRSVGWGAYLTLRTDDRAGTVHIRRDPTGRIPCWRFELSDVDLFVSSLHVVRPFQLRPFEVDWTYIAHHLNQDWLHGGASGLAGVTELLAGEEITYRYGQPATARWWRPEEIAQDRYASFWQAQAALREAAERSVAAWADLHERIVLDLSGGLDSAIVLGLLRRHARRQNVIGLNKVTPGEEGDERDYARAAARMHGIELLELSPSAADDLALPLPFADRVLRPQNRILPTGYDELGVTAARQSVATAFFTGSAGDHVFGASVGLSAARDYLEHGGALRGLLPLSLELAQLTRNTVWGAAGAIARSFMTSRPAPHEVTGWGNPLVTPAAAMDFARYTHPTALAASSRLPPAKLQQLLYILELQRHYQRYGRADVTEEVHVLFSEPMLEAALRTPAYWFGVDGVQRGLARRAFCDLLPPEILKRRSKGGSTRHFVSFLGRRLPRIRELLLEGRLMQHGLLSRPQLEAALTPVAIAAARDLNALMVCLCTELWVQQAEMSAR